MTLRTTVVGFLCGFFLLVFLAGPLGAQGLSPAQEQEFMDAREALQAAGKAQAETLAPEPYKQAAAFLATAESSRTLKDTKPFTQASRLARAYAEQAEAAAELKAVEEKLAATGEALRKIKAEFERLK